MTTSPNKIEASLSNLAHLMGIPLKQGWKTRLAEWFEVELRVLSKWLERNKIPEYRIEQAEKGGYPRAKWYIAPITEPTKPSGLYLEATDDRGIPAPDSRPPLCTRTDFNQFQGIATFDRPDSAYLKDVKEILASNETGIIAALKANIVQFREMVRDRQEREVEKKEWQKDKDRIKKLENQVDQLTKQLNIEKNADDLLHNPTDNAENE